jgi:membrane protein YqaA with SNARE-associated domain
MTLLVLWITTFAWCIAGAVIPFLNTEIYLISVAALSPPAFVAPLVVAATLGQMCGKLFMYYGGRGVVRIRNERVQRAVAALQERLEPRPLLSRAVLFSSATVGLPPLYVMSVLCGTIRMGVVSFFVIGSVGRLLHFAAVAALPQLARTWLG